MPAVTAVELGPDTCVLVRAALRGADVRVADVEILDPAAFPGSDAFVASLQQSRRKMNLPRRARVVLWGLPDGATPRDPAVRSLVAPLAAAGFRVQRVVSPCNALSALARIRTPRPDGAVGWLAVDRAGVAIVIARPGELLYSHTFTWDSSIGATGSQAVMLQRYSLVASLAPELRRGIASARDKGARVDTIITCGNLPDLRSLTMPLIEELDLEVETLDSLDGLTFAPEMGDRLRALAPAIRIACAGAATRETRPITAVTARPTPAASAPAHRRIGGGVFGAVALLVAVGGAGWWWYSQTAHRTPRSPVVARATTPPPASSAKARSSPPSSSATASSPQPSSPRTAPAVPAPVAPGPEAPSKSQDQPPPPSTAKTPPTASGQRTRAAAQPPAPLPPLLDEPLPQISTILASSARPFAMINGRIVRVGDHVGQRVVTAIEPGRVVFREPSGVQIRVGLAGRFLGVKR
jgi:hypothetical protein